MSEAKVVSHLGEGKYNVLLHNEISKIETHKTRLNDLTTKNNTKLSTKQAEKITKQSELDTATAEFKSAVEDYKTCVDEKGAGSCSTENESVNKAQKKQLKLNGELGLINQSIESLIVYKNRYIKELAVYDNVPPEWESIDVWCTDLCDNEESPAIPANTLVSLIDIYSFDKRKYERWIVPSTYGRDPTYSPNFGKNASSLASDKFGFIFNYNMIGPVLAWNPPYRLATITSIDSDTQTATVSYHQLKDLDGVIYNGNEPTAGIEFDYMVYGYQAFSVGDAVIVSFCAEKMRDPLIIGFYSNPRGEKKERIIAQITDVQHTPFNAEIVGNDKIIQTLNNVHNYYRWRTNSKVWSRYVDGVKTHTLTTVTTQGDQFESAHGSFDGSTIRLEQEKAYVFINTKLIATLDLTPDSLPEKGIPDISEAYLEDNGSGGLNIVMLRVLVIDNTHFSINKYMADFNIESQNILTLDSSQTHAVAAALTDFTEWESRSISVNGLGDESRFRITTSNNLSSWPTSKGYSINNSNLNVTVDIEYGTDDMLEWLNDFTESGEYTDISNIGGNTFKEVCFDVPSPFDGTCTRNQPASHFISSAGLQTKELSEYTRDAIINLDNFAILIGYAFSKDDKDMVMTYTVYSSGRDIIGDHVSINHNKVKQSFSIHRENGIAYGTSAEAFYNATNTSDGSADITPILMTSSEYGPVGSSYISLNGVKVYESILNSGNQTTLRIDSTTTYIADVNEYMIINPIVHDATMGVVSFTERYKTIDTINPLVSTIKVNIFDRNHIIVNNTNEVLSEYVLFKESDEIMNILPPSINWNITADFDTDYQSSDIPGCFVCPGIEPNYIYAVTQNTIMKSI